MRVVLPSPGLAHRQRAYMVCADWYRAEGLTDPGGGQAVEWTLQGTTDVQLAHPSAAEMQVAAQEGAQITHIVLVPTNSPLRRGDRVVVDDVTVELLSDPYRGTLGSVRRAHGKAEHWDEPIG